MQNGNVTMCVVLTLLGIKRTVIKTTIIKNDKLTFFQMTDVTPLEIRAQKVLDRTMLNNMAHDNMAFLYAVM